MNRFDLLKRVRSLTRDFSNSIFREEDIIVYINESIDRCKQVIPELRGMVHLDNPSDTPVFLPNEYHYLLAIYATSRCFGQDERHYQDTKFMNEFEQKLDELKSNIENGIVMILDPSGNQVTQDFITDYVVDNYFDKSKSLTDLDEGVEGVE